MFEQRKHHTWFDVGFGLVVAAASTFMACTFGSPQASCFPDCDANNDGAISEKEQIYCDLNKAPVRSLKEGDRWTVYEVPGKIRVQHGYGCAQQATLRTTESLCRVPHSGLGRGAPHFGDAGTIILNGWDVQYSERRPPCARAGLGDFQHDRRHATRTSTS